MGKLTEETKIEGSLYYIASSLVRDYSNIIEFVNDVKRELYQILVKDGIEINVNEELYAENNIESLSEFMKMMNKAIDPHSVLLNNPTQILSYSFDWSQESFVFKDRHQYFFLYWETDA